MRMKNLKKRPLTREGFKQRLSVSRERSKDLHSQIGKLSSTCTFLESRLAEILSHCVNSNNPRRASDVISLLSFRQCITHLRKFLPIWFPDPKIISEVKELTKRLDRVANSRNDIVHSYWVNYSPSVVAQHRPRSKGGKPSGFETHDASIAKKIENLVEDIDDLIYDLEMLFLSLNEILSEHGHAL